MKIIAISGEIGWDVWPDDIRRQIAEAEGEDIEFQISSPGGYIYDGLEIFNMIRDYPGKTITVASGMAASMASYLLMAGDEKKAASNAIFMIHNARGWAGGDQQVHRKLANILEGMSNLLGQEYVRQTGKSKEDIQSLMNEETYFFGNEILEAGFVDEMIEAGEGAVARDEAISNASIKVAAVIEKVKSNPEDIEKMAAILNPKKQTDGGKPSNNLDRGNYGTRQSATYLNNEEEKTMTSFEEFLASQAGKDAIARARAEGKAEGISEGIAAKQNDIDRIHPLISAEGASKALIESGFKALKGESSVDSFVAIADYETRVNEAKKSALADEEQEPDTPAGKDDEQINKNKPKNAEDVKALAAELKDKIL
jgi:ATP-dependent Clp endopeptidase proteolytic subunit ClpP